MSQTLLNAEEKAKYASKLRHKLGIAQTRKLKLEGQVMRTDKYIKKLQKELDSLK